MPDQVTASDSLIDRLRDPALYPAPCSSVELIETHISWVLLTGSRAYKIKKPVHLEFVDFSTLERRRHFCEEELRLNRRLAPDVYLEVIPITGTSERPKVGGVGRAIEYAVLMRQFEQSSLLSRILERGELTAAHIDRLAETVAAFHDRIAVADASLEFGSLDSIQQPVRANFECLRPLLKKSSQTLVADIEKWSMQELNRLQGEFAERRQAGRIRECHGDMHLGNMFLDNTTVTIFDGIEFNDALRWIDVMSEVAFLTMDLEDRGRPDLAFRFLNLWLERTGDYAGIRVLRFYQTYRAIVRAKIDAIRLQQGHLDHTELKSLADDCLGYLQQAVRYTQPRHVALMITNGFSGSGKTTGTQEVVERCGAVRIRSDVERRRLHGIGRHESSLGTIYSERDTQQTYARLAELAGIVLQAGFPVIVDATFLSREQRERFRQLANELHVPFCILQFAADAQLLRQRIIERLADGRDASEANLTVLEHQLQSADRLSSDELQNTIRVRPGDTSLGQRIQERLHLRPAE